MEDLLKSLTIYREMTNKNLKNLGKIIKKTKGLKEGQDRKKIVYDLNIWLSDFIESTSKYGLEGNLWEKHIILLLIKNENPFSLSWERAHASIDDSSKTMDILVKRDLEIIRDLYNFDFSYIEDRLQVDCFSLVQEYESMGQKRIYNKEVRERVEVLYQTMEKVKNTQEFYQGLVGFYKQYGVGKIGIYKGFHLGTKKEKIKLQPIINIENSSLDDLVGLEIQKKKLRDNTRAFIEGQKANNVLLFGDSGTGKSSSVKAILNDYSHKGLKVIEVYKHQFEYLNRLLRHLKTRNYKFIIYMDDLSFEEFEIEYKYLKAIIEGGLEAKANNVLVYATSNRRHIVRETWSDRSDMERVDDLHRSDTMEEKLSLVERFGLTINFSSPNLKEYHEIVESLARPHDYMGLSKEELLEEADKWELFHSGRSGRTAQQFIDYLLGQNKQNN